MLKQHKHFFELLWEMTEKELKARYKHTIFGFLWVVVNPLLQMLVIGFVFRLFIKEQIENYFVYLFSGLLVWNFFTLSLTKATPSIVFERALIKKSRFPHAVIPLSIVLSNLINLFIAFTLLMIPTVVGKQFLLVHLPNLVIALILLVSLTLGLCLLASALNVRFRDVNFFVQALLIIWFYATPIVYSIWVVPYDLMWLWRINPMTSVVQLFQYVFSAAPPPGIGMLVINSFITVVFVILGIVTFRRESKNFDDWI